MDNPAGLSSIRRKSSQPTALRIVLIISVFSTILVPIVAFRYAYNPLFVAGSAAGFLILLAASVFMWRFDQNGQLEGASTAKGAIYLGIILGILWTFEISINNFIAPPIPARDIIDDIFWGIIALSIFGFTCVGAYRTGQIRVGLAGGIWSGAVSGIFACGAALALIVFGMRFILQDPLNIAEWAARGTTTNAPHMAAYYAYETFAGAFLHLIVLGILMGLLLGLVGGCMGRAAKAVSGSLMGKTRHNNN